ncbi:MAG: hypothetical protein WC135_02795 [Bacteroidales bacterium]
MRKEIKDLIEEEKEILKQIELENRNNHLISLGLVVESNSEIDESTYTKEGNVSNKFQGATAIEVTDEEYKELCKYFPPHEVEKANEADNKMKQDISTMKSLFVFWTVLGILSIIITIYLLSKLS